MSNKDRKVIENVEQEHGHTPTLRVTEYIPQLEKCREIVRKKKSIGNNVKSTSGYPTIKLLKAKQ